MCTAKSRTIKRLLPQRRTKRNKSCLDQGRRALILRRDAGQWNVGLEGGSTFAADAEVVKPLLSSLGSLQIEDEISDRAGSRHRL